MRGANAAELVADVERQIAEGVLRPGDRLPPVRTLADELGLAPNTVAAAYRKLGERGMVVGKGRSGTFIAPRPPMATPAEPEVLEGLLDLARGNPDPRLLPALEIELTGNPVLYGHESFDPGLRDASRRSFAADELATDHLTVVSGALDGLERILMAHLRPGDRVAIEDPAFFSVIDLLGALGLIAVPVQIDDHGMVPEALREVVDGIAAAVITPRGQNPFGSAMSEKRRDELGYVYNGNPEALIVEDDYASVVAGAPYHSLTGGRCRWAVIRSAAKTYAPDLRVAIVTADDETVRRVEGRQRLGTGWVSHMLQRTVASLMNDAATDAALERASETYRIRRDAFVSALADHGVTSHGRAGLNVWVPVPDEAAAAAGMRDHGIAVRSGDRFRLKAAPGVRVTTAALDPSEAPRVARAMADVLGRNPQTARTA